MIKPTLEDNNESVLNDAKAKANESAKLAAHSTQIANDYSAARPILEGSLAPLDAKVFTIASRLLSVDNFAHAFRDEAKALREAKDAQEKVASLVLEGRLANIESFIDERKAQDATAEQQRRNSLVRRIRFALLGI